MTQSEFNKLYEQYGEIKKNTVQKIEAEYNKAFLTVVKDLAQNYSFHKAFAKELRLNYGTWLEFRPLFAKAKTGRSISKKDAVLTPFQNNVLACVKMGSTTPYGIAHKLDEDLTKVLRAVTSLTSKKFIAHTKAGRLTAL